MEWHENTFVDPVELMELLRSTVKPRTIHGTMHVYHNVFHGWEVVQCLVQRYPQRRKAKDVATVLMRCGYIIRVLKGGEIGAALQSTRNKLKLSQAFHDDDRMYMFAEKSSYASVLIVKVIKAEHLVPKSVQGLCNAFVIIQGPFGMLRTPTVQQTLHPEWRATYLLILHPADRDKATLGLELKDSTRMGARTCGRSVLSIDHLRLFLKSRTQLNLPKTLNLELVQGSPVSYLDAQALDESDPKLIHKALSVTTKLSNFFLDTSGQETRMECVKVTHWYSNISGKFYAKRKKIATNLVLDVWMSSAEGESEAITTALTPSPKTKMRPRAMTSEDSPTDNLEMTNSGTVLTKKNSLLRTKAFGMTKSAKTDSQAAEPMGKQAKHASFDSLVTRFNQRKRRVHDNIERTQHEINNALKEHGPAFLFYYPRLAFEIISNAGLSDTQDDVELFGDNRDVIDSSQWFVVAPMIPRLCRRAFVGTVFDKLAEIHVGHAAFLEALVAHKPFRIPYQVFATYVSALESEWGSFETDCRTYAKFSSRKKLPDMGVEEMPLANSDFVRGTVAQKASTGMLGTLWVTNKAVVYKRTRFIAASSVERKSLDAAVSAQESNSTIHQGLRIAEELESVDWKSKRVDNYSVYRFSSVKDRNSCLQVVKEIICFNRFCRMHLLPLLNDSKRQDVKGLENTVLALANEMLLCSVLTFRAILATQEESKAVLRERKTRSKRRDKAEKAAGDDGEESDDDFDVKGVLDEDNKEWEHVVYPFFYSMTLRYQKKKVHDISRGFLDLLDAVQEERKEVSSTTTSSRKSVGKLFDSIAEYLVEHGLRIEERKRYGKLPWVKIEGLTGFFFQGFFLFTPEQGANVNAMHSEALSAASSAVWIEDLREELAKQVTFSAKLHGLSQNVQLMRDLLQPVAEIAEACLQSYEDLTNWKDPIYNLVVISALVVLILNDAFSFTLAFIPIGVALLILQFRTLKEKGELPVLIIPQRKKRSILERYKETRGKYRKLKQTVYNANLALLKLRGLVTSEDARVTNTFLQFLVVLGVILIILPSYILQLIIVAHVFTSKMAFRQPMKRKIIEFVKLVWESIPHSPLFKPDGELVRMRGLINYADLDN